MKLIFSYLASHITPKLMFYKLGVFTKYQKQLYTHNQTTISKAFNNF